MKNEKNIEKVVLSIRLVFLGKFYNLSDQQFFFKLIIVNCSSILIDRTNCEEQIVQLQRKTKTSERKNRFVIKILCLSLRKHIYPYATVILQRL